MGKKWVDITGERFGHYVAISVSRRGAPNERWLFRCDCGNVVERVKGNVTSGGSRSCCRLEQRRWREARREEFAARVQKLRHVLTMRETKQIIASGKYLVGKLAPVSGGYLPGRLRGEKHQNAVLSDVQVAQLRELREHRGLTYEELAAKFNISKSGVASIVKGRRRG